MGPSGLPHGFLTWARGGICASIAMTGSSRQGPPRSVAFVDWSNVYLGAKKDYGIRVDPMKLREFLGKERLLSRAHYFSATDENSAGQSRFHEMLKRHGFIVHTQLLEERVRHVLCPECRVGFDPVCPRCGRPGGVVRFFTRAALRGASGGRKPCGSCP